MAAARAGAICFLTLAALVFAAAAVSGEVGAAVLVAVGASSLLAAALVCRYDRLPRSANRLIALAATLIIAEITFFQPSGERYAPLYLGVVVFVSFYFSRWQVLVQLLVAVALWALALGRVHSLGDAAQIWLLGAGTLIAAAVTMRSLGNMLARTAEEAKSQRALLDAFFVHAPAGSGSSTTTSGTSASTRRSPRSWVTNGTRSRDARCASWRR